MTDDGAVFRLLSSVLRHLSSDMNSFFRFVVVTFFFTGVLLLHVYLWNADYRAFYTLRRQQIEQNRLQQELWQKQLRLEAMTNPAAVSRRLGY